MGKAPMHPMVAGQMCHIRMLIWSIIPGTWSITDVKSPMISIRDGRCLCPLMVQWVPDLAILMPECGMNLIHYWPCIWNDTKDSI